MAYQSLYRRFRPQRFDEVVGQDHLVAALKNAVRDDRVGHAYLFSGPRGTGKTTTARLLAKALNCENLGADGEPCNSCQACESISAGTSMDLFELDAASNNGVDHVRELVASASLGNPGRRKVYILDEVHMLSTAASNALLKTLEEPPGHVVFVLATTDPQKVLPTIRSRTQHVELNLVGAEKMVDHVRNVAAAADIDITDEIVDHVVRRGGGSVRDTLSALDQVVAAGGVGEDNLPIDSLVEALGASDSGAALEAVARAVSAGADPRELAESLTRHLRDMFLVKQGAAPAELPQSTIERLTEQGRKLNAATIVRSLEALGEALVDARQAADPRLVVEVALVRLTAPELSGTINALAARVERLEAALASGASIPAADSPAASTPTQSTNPVDNAPAAPAATQQPPPAQTPTTPAPAASSGGGRWDDARAALAQANGGSSAPAARQPAPPASPPQAPTPQPKAAAPPSPPPAAPASPAPVSTSPAVPPPVPEAPVVEAPAAQAAAPSPAQSAPPPPSPPPAPSAEQASPQDAPAVGAPSITQVVDDWEAILGGARPMARAMFLAAELSAGAPGVVVCAMPNEVHRDRCAEHAGDIRELLSTHYGTEMNLELTVGAAAGGSGGSGAAAVPADHEVDIHDLTDAPPDGRTSVDRLTDAFPGARVVDTDSH